MACSRAHSRPLTPLTCEEEHSSAVHSPGKNAMPGETAASERVLKPDAGKDHDSTSVRGCRGTGGTARPPRQGLCRMPDGPPAADPRPGRTGTAPGLGHRKANSEGAETRRSPALRGFKWGQTTQEMPTQQLRGPEGSESPGLPGTQVSLRRAPRRRRPSADKDGRPRADGARRRRTGPCRPPATEIRRGTWRPDRRPTLGLRNRGWYAKSIKHSQ